MKHIVDFSTRYATVRNAFLALAVLLMVGEVLGRIDQPLAELAHGERKLDFQIGYDIGTVQRLFDAYGAPGRSLYLWDLLVDMLFPFSQAAASVLFAILAFRNATLQRALIAVAIAFLALDLVENGLFLWFLASYPSVSPGAVQVASIVTSFKRYALYIAQVQMLVGVLMVLLMQLRGKSPGGLVA